jgi:hypothetical protein
VKKFAEERDRIAALRAGSGSDGGSLDRSVVALAFRAMRHSR